MKPQITLGNGCAISDKMLYVPSYLDELDENLEHTRMFVLNLAASPHWFNHEIFEATIVSTCFRPESKNSERACYSLSNRGLIEIFNSTETIKEDIFKTPEDAITAGEMTDIKFIGKHAYVCGSGNQVYKRTSHGWTLISTDIRNLAMQKLSDAISEINKPINTTEISNKNLINATKKLREFTVLHSIDGLEESSIYSCGSNGAIWHWNGLNWSSVKSGTRQHLHDIHCVSDDVVLICGHNGTVLRGNHKIGFKRLATGNTQTHFWSIRIFKETIYLGSSKGLFMMTDNQITPCSLNIHTPSIYSVQTIDTRDDTLWVIADRFVLRRHANCWDLIEHPDNSGI